MRGTDGSRLRISCYKNIAIIHQCIYDMIKNYLKTAWRNIRKNKLFSFINVLGLAIGIVTFFIIMLYVQDELSYDKFNHHADRIARVIFQAEINGGKINEAIVMPPVAAAMKKDFPEVEDATRMVAMGYPKIAYHEKKFKNDRVAMADPNFLSIFTFPLVDGDVATVLSQKNSLVISQTAAEKYFGEEHATGKMLKLDDEVYTVTGVMKDMPSNAHFHFDILLSMTGSKDAMSDSWMTGNFYTYLLLKPGAERKQVEARLPAMVERYMGPQIQQKMGLSLEQFRTNGNRLGFALQALTDIHLKSNTSNELEPGGNIMYVYIFSGVAVFMLIVACINFVNLSTAGASRRAREVGVRKVVGSDRGQLMVQFLCESVLITFFALLIAYIVLQIALPLFNDISGKSLYITWKPTLAFIGLGVIVGLIAGCYPAFYLSSFKPVLVLKGRIANKPKSIGLRSGLVIFQFFISVFLIIGTMVAYQQMKYIQRMDIGYNRQHLLVIPNSGALGGNEQAFREDMLRNPMVANATLSWFKPAGPTDYNNALGYPLGDDKLLVNGVDFRIDDQYIPVMGMKMAAGRNFSHRFSTDSSAIILNETAVKAMGWTSESAIGETVVIQNSPRGQHFPYQVIGVVRNFNFKSLHEAISPLYMTYFPQGGLIFKLNTGDTQALLAEMKTAWDAYQTEEPFTYSFMDDLFNSAYAAEQKTADVLNIFSVLIIFVACLGLFGLVTYTAEQRTKEIGIRKVMGASAVQVVQMLSGAFLKLVVIASCIAFPAAWWGMNKWLQNFAYRIEIQWWVFALAALLSIAIALLTISFQAIKAAISNPVKALRSE